MKTPRKAVALPSLVFVLYAFIAGCNLLSPFDSPTDERSKLSKGMAQANNGECEKAKDTLTNIQPPSNDTRVALGWAYMCLANATASNIAASVYDYNASTNDLTVIGQLARKMLPLTTEQFAHTGDALGVMREIGDERVNVQVGIAQLVRAAGYLAKQYTNQASTVALTRDDIAPTACAAHAADCTVAGVAVDCTAAGHMSDSDATEFINAIADAAEKMQLAGAGDLTTLAGIIRTGVGSSASQARCFIRANIVPAD